MLDKLKYYWHQVTDHYYIEADYVELKPGNTIPELMEKQYIVYHSDGSIDYTKDAKIATPFGIILGGLIVKRLRLECKDLPNLQFSLISVNDAHFIDTISNGTTHVFTNMNGRQKIDFAAEELLKKIMPNPDVYGGGSTTTINANKKTCIATIQIAVANEATRQKVIETILLLENLPGISTSNVSFKGFPVNIVITEQTKIQ